MLRKKSNCFGHSHPEHFDNVFAIQCGIQKFLFVTFATTRIAFEIHIGKELHLDGHISFALTSLAASAGHIERKISGRPCSLPRINSAAESFANEIENLHIRCRIRARRTPYRSLIDKLDMLHEVFSRQFSIRSDRANALASKLLESGIKNRMHERGFARTGYSGNGNERLQREANFYRFQVICARTFNRYCIPHIDSAPLWN